MTDVVNEGSSLYLTISFLDELKQPLVPATIDWRIDDITNGIQIVDWTAKSPPGSTVTVTVSGAQNAIQDQANTFEERVFTVRINNGLNNQGLKERRYRIKNLHGQT